MQKLDGKLRLKDVQIFLPCFCGNGGYHYRSNCPQLAMHAIGIPDVMRFQCTPELEAELQMMAYHDLKTTNDA